MNFSKILVNALPSCFVLVDKLVTKSDNNLLACPSVPCNLFDGLKSAFIVTSPFSNAILRTNDKKNVFPEPYSPITSLKDEPPSEMVLTSLTKDFNSSLLPTCICCKPILGTTPLLNAWIIVSRSFGFITLIISVCL